MSYPILQKDYDVAAENIRCNADKIGARIYDILGYYGRVRVLALTKEEAQEAARLAPHTGFPYGWAEI